MKRILVDHKKCLSCRACETACAVEHHPGKSLLAALGDRKTQVNVRVFAVDHESFPVACRHCDPADCMNACPAGAIRREAHTGAVVIDTAACKACAMCAMVCPFDAISFK
jgi:carbon-monoxide dehydrogenase iron sulfur subunit